MAKTFMYKYLDCVRQDVNKGWKISRRQRHCRYERTKTMRNTSIVKTLHRKLKTEQYKLVKTRGRCWVLRLHQSLLHLGNSSSCSCYRYQIFFSPQYIVKSEVLMH